WRVPAEHVAGTQQRAQFPALRFHGLCQPVATLPQLRQLRVLAPDPGLELAQPAGDARDLFVALAQRTHGLATLSLQAPPLAGDLAQLLAHAFEPALGLARVLLRRRRQRAG